MTVHHTKSFLSFYDQPFNLLSWSHFHITTPGNSGLYLVGRHDLFKLRFHLVVLSAPAVDIGLLTMIALVLIWKNSSQPAILFPN